MSDRKRPAMYVVTWVDSASTPGWRSAYDPIPLMPTCESVGFLVAREKDRIVLALSRGVTEEMMPWADLISIPTASIKACKRVAI